MNKTAVYLSLSAFLLTIGTYLSTIEVPVWIGSETELMHIYKLFFSFPLCIVSGVLLILGVVSILRRPSEFLQPGRAFSALEPILACGFGALVLTSVFLPWANVEVLNPTIVRPEFGSFTIERYHSLSGFSLVSANYWERDVMYMVFVGVAIALLYFPLMVLVEKLVASKLKAVLLLLSGVSILLAVFSILATERWSISAAFWGGGGAFSTTFRSPGVGLLFAAASSVGLIVLGAVIGLRWVLNVFPRGLAQIRSSGKAESRTLGYSFYRIVL